MATINSYLSFDGQCEEDSLTFQISINTHSREETEKLFNGLSADGNITMPLADTFWSAYFGMWTDKFGINWMVKYDDPAKVQPH